MKGVFNKSHKGLVILLFFTFFMVIGFDMIMPLVAGHYVNDLRFSATMVAIALAVRQFSQQGLALIGGRLSDRYSIKLLICTGVGFRAAGFIVLAFSGNYPLLIFSMFIIGIGGVLFEMPYQTAIASLTNEENRAKFYSLNNTVTGIGGSIGPILGILLLKFEFVLVCTGAAFCFLVNFIIAYFFLGDVKNNRNVHSLKKSLKIIINDRVYLRFVLIMMIFWLAASQIDISYPLRVQRLYGSTEGIGIMYSLYAVVTMLLQYPMTLLLAKRFAPRKIVVMGICIIAASLLLTGATNDLNIFWAIVVCYSFGMLLARPNQQNMAVSIADKNMPGLYLGLNSFSFSIGKGVGTIIGGMLFDITNAKGLEMLPWYIYGTVALVSMFGFIKFKEGKHHTPV